MKEELRKSFEKAKQEQKQYKAKQLAKIEEHKKKLKSLLWKIFAKFNS